MSKHVFLWFAGLVGIMAIVAVLPGIRPTIDAQVYGGVPLPIAPATTQVQPLGPPAAVPPASVTQPATEVQPLTPPVSPSPAASGDVTAPTTSVLPLTPAAEAAPAVAQVQLPGALPHAGTGILAGPADELQQEITLGLIAMILAAAGMGAARKARVRANGT